AWPLFLVHLAGRYSTRRKYYENPGLGGQGLLQPRWAATVQKTALDRAISFIVDLIQSAWPTSGATLMLAYEICQLVLMYNQTAREMSSMMAAASNFGLADTQSTSALIRRFRRKRVFVRAFLLNVSYNMCHKTLLRSLFALRAKEGCDQVQPESPVTTALYLSLISIGLWRGLPGSAAVKVVATSAHAATRSRMMRSFVEAVPHWPALGPHDSLRRQNGLILFRAAGLTFRGRLSRSVLYWILALPTPPGCAGTAPRKIRLRPVINVGQRIVDHEVLQPGGFADAFYRPSWPDVVSLAALASCLFDSQLAVLKSPYYCIGDLASVNFARRISSGLVNWVAHLLSAARASLQSVRCPNKQINRKFCCCPASWPLLRSCCEKSASLASAEQKNAGATQQQQQQLTPSASTGGTGHNLVREKYTREETELVLSSLAEAGLRQRLIDGSRADEA
uniref:ABC transmembrane type-1 domain-containing protein n=1 Tax=Macrostomum lignano TaxID=282301 RepID=A0A1I8FQ57_9PLAT